MPEPTRTNRLNQPAGPARCCGLNISTLLITILLLAPICVALGCRQDDEPSKPTGSDDSSAQAASAAVKLKETWDAVYLADTKVGTVHTVFESIELQGQTMVKADSASKLEIRRADQVAVMQTRVTAIETEKGVLKSFTLTTSVGPTPVIVEGTSRDGALHLVTTSQGKTMQSTMPWDETQGGFFALEQSLSAKPMETGEKRELTMLMPGMAGIQVATTTLQAATVETVELLGGSQQLLKILMSNQIGGQLLDSVCWTTPEGEVLKTSVPGLQQTIYRTTQARAEAAGSGDYDLFRDSIVKVASPLPHPHQLTRAEYSISLASQDPSQIFGSGGSQLVQSTGQRQARVTVMAVRPESPRTGSEAPAPGANDLASNSLIQSDAPEVVKMAQQLVGTASDPWTRCLLLERGVHQAIQAKNFGQGFATAADVARTLEGDCTEHAVLLAALCRAQGIPARVALGLVYSPRDQGFAFHMWDEAWVGDRWIPLDATLGLGGIGAAHLKLGHSNLTRQQAEAVILSVVQVINQLKIEVLDVQPQ